VPRQNGLNAGISSFHAAPSNGVGAMIVALIVVPPRRRSHSRTR